jgi:hypothetical protein
MWENLGPYLLGAGAALVLVGFGMLVAAAFRNHLEETPGRNVANAVYLAAATDLSYCNEPEGPEEFKSELGLDAILFSAGNTQAYVATDDDHIVVALPGTEAPSSIEGLKGWLLTDANNYVILTEGAIGTDFAAAGVGARFHKGFMTAVTSRSSDCGTTSANRGSEAPCTS